MSSELIEQLRFLGMDEAADEIERLRALITAWCDSLDNGISYTDHLPKVEALRKAVGR